MAMNSLQKMYIEMVEKALDRYVSRQRCNDDHVLEAMRYAVLGGGKRVRALLVLNFNRVLGGAANDAMEFAAAIEMVGYLTMTLIASFALRLVEKLMDGSDSYQLVQEDPLVMTAGTYSHPDRGTPFDERSKEGRERTRQGLKHGRTRGER